MTRIVLTYGLISGLIVMTGMIGTIVAAGGGEAIGGVWLGYLIMLVGLSAFLVGEKQHRDRTLGGVITFRQAFLLGLGIAAVASVAYIVIWEVYLALTNYTFMDKYAAQTLEAKRAAGVSGAAYDKLVADMDAMRRSYANPLFRVPMTLVEVLPVGLLVSLVSAGLLRNPKFLPARSRPTGG